MLLMTIINSKIIGLKCISLFFIFKLNRKTRYYMECFGLLLNKTQSKGFIKWAIKL